MKVNIADKDAKTVTGEMVAVEEAEVGRIVGEMITEPAKLKDLGFSDEIVAKATTMKEATSDENPEFPVIRVEEGWSKSRRLWPAKEVNRIVDQTNSLEPVGHLGHIPDDEMDTAFPDVQTTWLGAYAKDEPSQLKERVGEMVRVAYFVGYNHKGAKIRELIKAKAVRGVSWWGRANHIPIPGRGVEMRDFDLLTIDWARKNSEGMPSSSIVAIAGEMEDSKMAEVDLAQVTPEQFKKDNPNGYALLVSELDAEHKKTVGEMEEKVKDGEAAVDELGSIKKLLKVEDGKSALDTVTTLMSRLGAKAAELVKAELDKVLGEKIEDEGHRQIVRDLLPVGEMEAKAADATDEEAAKKLVGEMVDTAFDTSDSIKLLVGEQAPAAVRRREELGSGHGDGQKKNRYVTERSRVTVS
jgi:hypothetical protein